MVYKNKEAQLAYYKGYYAGWRKALIYVFGGKCSICGSTENLELDHIDPIIRKAGSLQDLKDIGNIRLVCHDCNVKLEVEWQRFLMRAVAQK